MLLFIQNDFKTIYKKNQEKSVVGCIFVEDSFFSL